MSWESFNTSKGRFRPCGAHGSYEPRMYFQHLNGTIQTVPTRSRAPTTCTFNASMGRFKPAEGSGEAKAEDQLSTPQWDDSNNLPLDLSKVLGGLSTPQWDDSNLLHQVESVAVVDLSTPQWDDSNPTSSSQKPIFWRLIRHLRVVDGISGHNTGKLSSPSRGFYATGGGRGCAVSIRGATLPL